MNKFDAAIISLLWVFRGAHLSDFHFQENKDPYERNTVLKPLLDEIRRRREDEGFQVDALFATGDIAYSGKAKEYKAAKVFFDELLPAWQIPIIYHPEKS